MAPFTRRQRFLMALDIWIGFAFACVGSVVLVFLLAVLFL